MRALGQYLHFLTAGDPRPVVCDFLDRVGSTEKQVCCRLHDNLKSIGSALLLTSRDPICEREFEGRFLKIKIHESKTFQKPSSWDLRA